MISSQISPLLGHLSKADIKELIEQYYDNSFAVSELIELFEIRACPSQLVALFPPYEDTKKLCPYCLLPMMRKWRSRPATEGNRLSPESYCHQCGHRAHDLVESKCKCNNCVEKERADTIERNKSEWEQIYSIIGKNRVYKFSGDIFDIDLESAIYLMSLERQSISNEIGIFSPISESVIPCSPHIDFTYDIINHLMNRGYIHIDPSSSRDAFSIEPKGIFYDLFDTTYFADLGQSHQKAKAVIQDLELAFRNKTWPAHWRTNWQEAIQALWEKINVHDLLQYLEVLGMERDFDMPKGDKTKAVLANATTDRSVSVAYSYAWSAVTRASDYYQSKKVSRKQAANSIVGTIQNYIDKVRLGVWEPKFYNRYKGFKQSALYSVFFCLVLQIGDDGFSKTFEECLPLLNWIDNNTTR